MKKNLEKGLTVSKWLLINRPKIPQMPQKCSAQFVCPSPKVWDFQKKRNSLGVRSSCHWTLKINKLTGKHEQ